MSRSGYSEDEGFDGQFDLWRANVDRAIHGKRGQKLLTELAAAMDAMPVKRLIAGDLRQPVEVEYNRVFDPPGPNNAWGRTRKVARLITSCAAATYQAGAPVMSNVCALGVVGEARGMALEAVFPKDWADDGDYDDSGDDHSRELGQAFDIAACLAAEITYENDEAGRFDETPERRWTRMRAWVAQNIRPAARSEATITDADAGNGSTP